MRLVETQKVVETWARATQVGKMINQKFPYNFLKDFKKYCDLHPKAFKPHKPMIQRGEKDTEYNIFAIMYYWENKHLLDADIKIEPFYDDLQRLKQVYCMEGA